MSDAPKTPGPPGGIRCPRCGCGHLYTVRTLRLPKDRVRRYKVCRHCGRRLTTVEALPSDAAARRDFYM